MPFGTTYIIIRSLASAALGSFFSKIQVEGKEFVPSQGGEEEGPLLVLANHWNSAVDPAILSSHFPYQRKLHYWAKSTLFLNPLLSKILISAGNISVDRKNKVNQSLFATTFDSFKLGENVCIFPEGGSFTRSGFGTFKDGASWAALEYAKNVRMKDGGKILSTGEKVKKDPRDVIICIVGITYSDKAKYRSRVLVQFGPSITVTSYVEEFLIDPKSAVKKLTYDIQEALKKVTVNSPDWESLNSANLMRKILWINEEDLDLRRLRDLSQLLVDHFSPSNPHSSPALTSLRTLLLAYHQSLRSTRLTHYSLTNFALPPSLDPSIPYPLPGRFKILFTLFLRSLNSLLRLPFFLLPLLIHLPIYIISKFSIRLSTFEEDYAQNKIALGLIWALGIYLALFGTVWWGLFLGPFPLVGGIVAAGGVWVVRIYHEKLIDGQYNGAKKLVATWRVLLGIWAPLVKIEASSVLGLGLVTDSATTSTTSTTTTTNSTATTEKEREEEEGGKENEIRKVLRLRIQVSKTLIQYLLNLESNLSDTEQARYGREFVGRLRGWGAQF